MCFSTFAHSTLYIAIFWGYCDRTDESHRGHFSKYMSVRPDKLGDF